ncbi:hypothetical protein Tco_1023249, partial [Tanacetum coccineum]
SGGSFAFQLQNKPSLCDAPNLQERVKQIGGKDSIDHAVKGSYKAIAPELITQLKAICQVILLTISFILLLLTCSLDSVFIML